MRIHPTDIPDLLSIELTVHRDQRGFFVETWRDEWTAKLKLDQPFIQDNYARSEKAGVLRGLHFQAPPAAQAKVVWVSTGAVYDVAVDLRKGSPTYGRWHGLVLTGANMIRFFIPEGFAHGYLTLEPGTEFHYKVTRYYSPQHEGGIRHNDPGLNIPWPSMALEMTERDRTLPLMEEADSPFVYRKKR